MSEIEQLREENARLRKQVADLADALVKVIQERSAPMPQPPVIPYPQPPTSPYAPPWQPPYGPIWGGQNVC